MKTFIALGDSYTVGEAVNTSYSWPFLLTQKLNKEGDTFALPKVLATTGWTTGELLKAMESYPFAKGYDLVSLQIGVNNQYRGHNIRLFKQEFEILIDKAIDLLYPKGKLFVLSIPDYSVTPFAKSKNIEKISTEIVHYNSIIKSICDVKKIPFFDITPISKQAKDFPDFNAQDGLHPSSKMYEEWVNSFSANIKKMFVGK